MAHIIVYSQLKIMKISRKSAQHLKNWGGGGGGGALAPSAPLLTTPLVKLSDLFAGSSKLFVLVKERAYLLIRDCRISY